VHVVSPAPTCICACSLSRTHVHLCMFSLPVQRASVPALSSGATCICACSLFRCHVHLCMFSLPLPRASVHVLSSRATFSFSVSFLPLILPLSRSLSPCLHLLPHLPHLSPLPCPPLQQIW
jgi:hypothetical protein